MAGQTEAKDVLPLMPGRLALKVTEVAKSIDISRASIHQVVARGKVRVVRMGRRILIPVAELQRMLTRLDG